MKKIGTFITILILSYVAAYPVGHWAESRYKIGGSWIGIGSFPGFFDGFILSYAILSPVLFVLLTKNFKLSLVSIVPVILFATLGSGDPWSKYLWFFVAAGLGLAWATLQI